MISDPSFSWEDPEAFLLPESAPAVSVRAPDTEKMASHLSLEDERLLPPYLRENEPAPQQHTYGTLSLNRKSRCWVVKGDPSVTEMCKRLFPGSVGSKRGEARFSLHRRSIEDLCWLMMRFPLTVRMADLTVWNEAVAKARAHARILAVREQSALPSTPSKSDFCGELMDFQKEGFSFLLLHDRCLLADEMGLGKTVQAIACIAEVKSFPVLVVPPPHLVLNWEHELRRFLRIHGTTPRIHIIHGLAPYPLPEADVYIMHYLLLRGWKKVIPALPFRVLILDEVQELRHSGTEKYSAASLLSDHCDRVIGLSGTPIYNEGGEIWNVINILDFQFLGSWESFSREWCTGYGNRIVAKPDILGSYLKREGLMLRRTKADVLSELPPKRRLVQTLDWNDAMYRKLMEPVIPLLYQWKNPSELTAGQRSLLEQSISQQARQATGIAKAPFVCQFVRAMLEGGERVLLFAHHHAVFDLYMKELAAYHPGMITGRETIQEKAAAADRFLQDQTRLLCISLRSASGLNLQHATCVVFGELDWSPAVHAQAEDRAHRIGQTDSLLCYYLVSPGGSDALMQEALGLKVSQFISLMGDVPLSQEQVMENASYARRHVQELISMLPESGS